MAATIMIQNRGESARPSVRCRLKVRKLSGSESKLSAFVTISMIPVKMLEVARVMMKLLIPVRVMRKPLINPRMTARVRPSGDRDQRRHAKDFHHPARKHGNHPADRADRQVHLAGGERHHLGKGDHDLHGGKPHQGEQVVFGAGSPRRAR